MIYLNAFITCGTICLLGQIIYDNTKLTPGHITSLFVVIGVLLDGLNLYDLIINFAGMGASIPITSFGHSLMHATMEKISESGILGILNGMFDMVTPGISFTIFISFVVAIIFKAKS